MFDLSALPSWLNWLCLTIDYFVLKVTKFQCLLHKTKLFYHQNQAQKVFYRISKRQCPHGLPSSPPPPPLAHTQPLNQPTNQNHGWKKKLSLSADTFKAKIHAGRHSSLLGDSLFRSPLSLWNFHRWWRQCTLPRPNFAWSVGGEGGSTGGKLWNRLGETMCSKRDPRRRIRGFCAIREKMAESFVFSHKCFRVSQKKSNGKNSSSTSIFWIDGIYIALESWFQPDLKAPSLP